MVLVGGQLFLHTGMQPEEQKKNSAGFMYAPNEYLNMNPKHCDAPLEFVCNSYHFWNA